MLHVLVCCETGAIGGNLEEHATRLAEVDRMEVEAIDHWRHGRVDFGNTRSPEPLFLLVGRAEGHVMHAADAYKAVEWQARINLHMHLRACSARADFKDSHRCLLLCLVAVAAPEAKHVGQKMGRAFEVAQREPHSEEAVNHHL